MRKTQVYIDGIQTMVSDSLLIEGVKYYNADMTEDTAKETEIAIAKLIKDGEALVTNYIQARVDELNEELGTKFGNIHNVANYMHSTTYPHAARCSELWDWNERVWTKAREEQVNAVATNISEEDFIAILDTVTLGD